MTIRLQATLPPRQSCKYRKRKGVRTDKGARGNVVQAHFGLPLKMYERLENRVKNTKKTRSHISREALDFYFLKVNKEPLQIHQICAKDPIVGLKHIPITIRRDQSSWLRMMAEKTGKKISQLGREAIEYYLDNHNSVD